MNAEQRKEHILTCAKKLFASRGFYKTQISDIIHEAGIARGTVYQYFASKDDLLNTLIDRLYHDFENFISVSATEMKKYIADPGAYMKYRIRRTLEFFYGDLEMCQIIFRIGLGLQPQFDSLIRRFEKKIVKSISEDLDMGKRFRTIREDIDTEFTANLVAGGLFRLSYMHFAATGGKLRQVLSIDEITSQIENIFKYGIFTNASPVVS